MKKTLSIPGIFQPLGEVGEDRSVFVGRMNNGSFFLRLRRNGKEREIFISQQAMAAIVLHATTLFEETEKMP